MEKLTGLYDLRIPLSNPAGIDRAELIARAIRDCFYRHEGNLDKKLMDKTIKAVGEHNPDYKAIWKDFKGTFSIVVKNGCYHNPYTLM